VVLDESRSYESRELVAKMTGTEYFDVVKYVDSMDEMRTEIDSRQRPRSGWSSIATSARTAIAASPPRRS
jgi:hypothetical protein